MIDLFKYYGIDWLAFFLYIETTWLIGNKDRRGFLFGIAANFLGLWFSWYVSSVASFIMNIMFIVMNLRGYIKWNSKSLDNS